jgi:phosphoglucosamine mutase
LIDNLSTTINLCSLNFGTELDIENDVMLKLFGTDGVRGTANIEPMTAETAMRLGMAAGYHFTRGAHRHNVVIGKDTRLSGYMLESAMTAGFTAVGMDVLLLGPLPTPAVAMLTRSMRSDLGVMISASHNSFEDNGIKLFGPDGFKLSDITESKIEMHIKNGLNNHRVTALALGRARRLNDALGRYIEHTKNTFPRGLRLNDLKIVVDCANGAAYKVAPTILWELGAEVIPIGITPDGFNINNNCGSLFTDMMREQVVLHSAHLGLSLDGDADRLVICDEQGSIIDGDQMMALIGKNWHNSGILKGNGLVATVMSNFGLDHFLNEFGLILQRTNVGDRYVIEKMRKDGYNLGGEQSGHIIMSDYSTTGDGLVVALQLLAAFVEDGRPASNVFRLFTPLPQVLKNIRVPSTIICNEVLNAPSVLSAILAGKQKLDKSGRLLIRKSGTESLIRVMAEGENEVLINQVIDDVIDSIRKMIEK